MDEEAQRDSDNVDDEQTIESASFLGYVSSTGGTIEASATDTSQTPAEAEASDLAGPQVTVPLAAEQTIDLSNLDGNADDQSSNLVTSQWESVVDKNVHIGQTIRQRETVGSHSGSKSSLAVKSRQLRHRNEAIATTVTPDEVPDYELLNIIGEGGMGVVYAAQQNSIARTVAIKMLKPGSDRSELQRDKFISEAVVTGELDHPNIVPIYDLGANDEGALFYSMKHVRGTPWNKVIEEKSIDENLNVLLRCADAVAFAHANGVVHRDLKPENVMLTGVWHGSVQTFPMPTRSVNPTTWEAHPPTWRRNWRAVPWSRSIVPATSTSWVRFSTKSSVESLPIAAKM